MRLTDSVIRGLKKKINQYEVFDSTGARNTGRLGVRVTKTGKKIFIYRYYWNKKPRFITLGAYSKNESHGLTLRAANERANAYSSVYREGKDPKGYKPALAQEEQCRNLPHEETGEMAEGSCSQSDGCVQKLGSIGDLIIDYTENMKVANKGRTAGSVRQKMLTAIDGQIDLDTQANSITVQDISKMLYQMISRGANTGSNRVQSYFHAAFVYGMSHDHDPKNMGKEMKYGLISNPVAPIPKQRENGARKRYLNTSEMKHFYGLLTAGNAPCIGEQMALLFQLGLYTGGQRFYELLTLEWRRIDLKNKVIEVAEQFSKNHKSHLVPLSDKSIDVLERLRMLNLHKGSSWVFPHEKDASLHMRGDSVAQSLLRFQRKTNHFGFAEPFQPRDLRRTCKTHMGAAGISKEIRDRLQNHAFNDVSSVHYDRYDYLNEKRRAISVWCRELEQVL